jgi:hypothetical protein
VPQVCVYVFVAACRCFANVCTCVFLEGVSGPRMCRIVMLCINVF